MGAVPGRAGTVGTADCGHTVKCLLLPQKVRKNTKLIVTFLKGEPVRVMDGFDNLFSDESCVISENRSSLFSLHEVKSYAEAWGGQGR